MASVPTRLTEPSGKEAELYRNLANGKVQCTACARLCQIGEGQVGLCGIRGVVGGKLYLLVYGKVIAGHIDPIEKKPVVHYKPGSKIFSVATTGCNWLCSYCFTPDMTVLTDRGLISIGEIFDRSEHEEEIGHPDNLRVLSHAGFFRHVEGVFKHRYSGKVLRIRPYYLPEVKCTPNHKIFAFNRSNGSLEMKRADQLTTGDMLAVPNAKDSIASRRLDSYLILHAAIPKVRREGKRGSTWTLKERDGRVKFGMSRGEGVPRDLEVDEDLAEFMGLYCAEGSVSRSSSRPSSWTVSLSFGAHETDLISRAEELARKVFNVSTSRVTQGSVTRITTSNNVLAVLLSEIAGEDCYKKKVPDFILHNKSPTVLRAFLNGYVRGDGYLTGSRKQRWLGSTSVSRELSLGVWYMMFRLGAAPRFYVANNPPSYEIEGRTVSRHGDYLTRLMVKSDKVEFNPAESGASKIVRMEDCMLVPIRAIREEDYDGYVYNMEVSGEHSYSASFVAVSNCQNYDISQRRKIEGIDATPEQVATMATSHGCEGMAYTYNQPTIFMEYARDIGRIAREKGIFNIFVSNGFDTPETVALMKDFLDCITVDFKGSGETGFVRRYIGIPNADPIFQTLLEVKNKTNVHIEITDLVVPQVGDNLESATRLSKWVYDNLGPDMPIHFLRWHPDYKMMDLPLTPIETLEKHYEIAKNAGLKYVYIGNVPGHPAESTYCPGCSKVLIKRFGYDILEYNLDKNNRCRFCGYKTPIVGPLSKSFKDDRFIPVIN